MNAIEGDPPRPGAEVQRDMDPDQISKLKNPQHERFAQLIAAGQHSQQAAYEASGLRGKNAPRLLKRPEVQERIGALRGDAAERAGTSIDDIVRDLNQAREIAQARGNPSAMVAATMAKAKVLGLIVERKTVGLKRLEDMSEVELRMLLGDN